MNNLKRILSLALASVMVMGMMVVGASATSYPDDEKIVNKEAVDTLAALNIMNGDERGFRPEDGLTRAEAAKMLATIHNKGVAVNFGTKSTPTFTDIKGHWAEGNVEYAAAFGIVNGKGNGIFDPQGSLRVVELARMTLNMLGYDEGKTGSDWELLTTVSASNNGLFDGLESVNPTANVTRDQAAQILVNAINTTMANAETVVTTIWSVGGVNFQSYTDAKAYAEDNKVNGVAPAITQGQVTDSETLGTKYLNLHYDKINYIAKVEDDGKGTYTVTMGDGTQYTKVAEDYSNMMGQLVTVMYKTRSSVYGMTATGTVIYEGAVGAYTPAGNTATKNAIKAAKIYDFNNFDPAETRTIETNSLVEWQSLKVIKNGNSYLAVTIPQTLTEVTNVTAKYAQLKGETNKVIDEEIVLNGAAKGDIVLKTPAANTVSGMIELSKVEIMENVAADAYRGTNQVRINGSWLTVVACQYDEETTGFNELKKMAEKKSYDLVMVNGYICGVSLAVSDAEVSKDLLILTEVATGSTDTSGVLNGNKYQEARAYFVADGSTAVIRLKVVDNTPKTSSDAGKLYTYTVKDNLYTLDTPVATNLGYAGAIDDTGVGTNNQINNTLIDEAAQIIVLLDEGKVEVVTGKAARAWALSSAFGTTKSVAYTKNVNGVPYVQFAFLNATDKATLPGAGATGKDYGYIVSTPYTTSKGTVFTIWTGTEEKEVTDTGADKATLAKGDFIEYKTGDGVIVATKLTPTADAVRGWNTNDKVLKLEVAGNKVIDDKTVYLYIDTETTKGQPASSLAQADADEDVLGKYIANVKFIVGDEGHIDLLIVDVQNDMGESVGTATETPAAHTHVWEKEGTAKAATCGEAGSSEYYVCNVENCPLNKAHYKTQGTGTTAGDTFGTNEENPPASGAHTLTTATDNSDGTHTGTCDVCNNSATMPCADSDTDGSCDVCGATVTPANP